MQPHNGFPFRWCSLTKNVFISMMTLRLRTFGCEHLFDQSAPAASCYRLLSLKSEKNEMHDIAHRSFEFELKRLSLVWGQFRGQVAASGGVKPEELLCLTGL